MKRLIVLFYCSCTLFLFNCNQNQEEKIISTIVNHRNTINNVCLLYDIDPRIYVSVVYSELINNYNALDNYDEFRARIGMNPSLGFAQMRVSTCVWLENNYSGNYGIHLSKTRVELVNKMINDSINIHYSCLYINLIKKRFEETYPRGMIASKHLATYYGKGIDESNETITTLTINKMGVTADSFYYSHKLLKFFPR